MKLLKAQLSHSGVAKAAKADRLVVTLDIRTSTDELTAAALIDAAHWEPTPQVKLRIRPILNDHGGRL